MFLELRLSAHRLPAVRQQQGTDARQVYVTDAFGFFLVLILGRALVCCITCVA